MTPPGKTWHGPGTPPPKRKPNYALWAILGLLGICFLGLVATVGSKPKQETSTGPTASATQPGPSTAAGAGDDAPTSPVPSTAEPTTTAPPTPEQRAKDITTENLVGTPEIVVTNGPTQMDIEIHKASAWDEVSVFHAAFYDAGKIMPKLFADPALAAVPAVCLHQVLTFTDPYGKASDEDATRLCLSREKEKDVNFDGTDPDRLYFASVLDTLAVDGIEFYVHPGILKKIDFE